MNDYYKKVTLLNELLAQLNRLMTQLRNTTMYETAVSYLGTDASPSDLAPDELGCAESVTNILRNHVSMPIILGTYTLYEYLERDPRFRRVTIAMPGNIVLSPTGTSTKRKTPFVGHVGIMGKNDILMSNSSETGKWSANYTLESWKARYAERGGYPVLIYALA